MLQNLQPNARFYMYFCSRFLNNMVQLHHSEQESMDIEVPCLKDVATEVKPNLQDRLNAVTEILSRVSKLVSDDLDKAVSATVGQDNDGNQSSGSSSLYSLNLLCSQALNCSPGSPQDKRPVLAVVPSPAAPSHPGGKEGLSACEFLDL